ncbi:tetratricopeptide repeat protein [Microbulbifer sediminum]|uniref:tetratricopeptide repeat protein n=1 Tax=Microbulbifer sediminum TaxID=2904250 RepID=UPI002107DEB1|nr:tetratricopeptide repeat protein [Microbulbifer sediminum]
MKNVSEKISQYLGYLKLDPANAILCVQLGDLYHSQGDLEEARKYFTAALDSEPENSVYLSRLGNLCLSEHKFLEAVKLFEHALEIAQGDTSVMYNLGLARFYAKQFEYAQGIFESLEGENEGAKFPDLDFYLVSSLHNQGKKEEAISQAETLLAKKSDNKLRGYLSLIQMDNFDMGAAVKTASEVLAHDPENVDAATVLGNRAIEEQETGEAKKLFDLVAEREPESPRGWQGKGLVALLNKDLDLAEGYFRKTLEIDPNQVGNYNTLGWTYIIKHQFERAEDVFRKGIEANRNNSEVHGGLAVALVFQNKLDEGRREADTALKLNKFSFGAVYAKSIMLQLKGKEKVAAKVLGGMLDQPLGNGKASLMDHLRKYESRNGGQSDKTL